MKKNGLFLLILAMIPLFCANHVHSTESVSTQALNPRGQDLKVEVAVSNVLIAASGFDDNDWVGGVITGELPSACFSLAETQVERADATSFRVHQWAWLRTDGSCDSGDLVDDPVPYTLDLNLGRLASGAYAIRFDPDRDPRDSAHEGTPSSARNWAMRKFAVDVATVNEIDALQYAHVTGASVDGLYDAGNNVSITLSGIFSSRCTQLVEPIQIQRIDDVYVILPIIEKSRSADCARTPKTFQKEIDLGAPASGEYLVHVRSRNGKAVNAVFNVMKKR